MVRINSLQDVKNGLAALAPYLCMGSLCCTCCGWIIAISIFWMLRSMGDLQAKAEAWDVPFAWRETTCEVLAAGVACTDQETRSTCSGYRAGAMPSSQPPVFLTEQIAVCPGTYWCSKEEETCHCNGEITYAPELFDGAVYTVPSAEQTYKVTASGSWKCGTDQSGKPFAVDPAPWHVKHCWCTPHGILQIIKEHDESNLHKKECSEAVTFDFNAPRSLGEDDESTWEEPEETQEIPEGRRLHDSRRRRTLKYTPWALVSVPSGSNLAPRKKQIACAYEYGVPMGPSEMYHSDGPYSGDVWKVEEVAKKWGNHSSRTCWVRSHGEAGQSLEDCAVALVKPGTLEAIAQGLQAHFWKLFWVFLSLGIVCCGVLFGGCYVVGREVTAERTRQQQQEEQEAGRLMTNE
mmetsp:Transcript_1143/g.2915  ORF Transcript_1143/g.2915 Transcript_1143/m.2915 type:complete len:405 (-) Transcript_1143:75-1289(-)